MMLTTFPANDALTSSTSVSTVVKGECDALYYATNGKSYAGSKCHSKAIERVNGYKFCWLHLKIIDSGIPSDLVLKGQRR